MPIFFTQRPIGAVIQCGHDGLYLAVTPSGHAGHKAGEVHRRVRPPAWPGENPRIRLLALVKPRGGGDRVWLAQREGTRTRLRLTSEELVRDYERTEEQADA